MSCRRYTHLYQCTKTYRIYDAGHQDEDLHRGKRLEEVLLAALYAVEVVVLDGIRAVQQRVLQCNTKLCTTILLIGIRTVK